MLDGLRFNISYRALLYYRILDGPRIQHHSSSITAGFRIVQESTSLPIVSSFIDDLLSWLPETKRAQKIPQ